MCIKIWCYISVKIFFYIILRIVFYLLQNITHRNVFSKSIFVSVSPSFIGSLYFFLLSCLQHCEKHRCTYADTHQREISNYDLIQASINCRRTEKLLAFFHRSEKIYTKPIQSLKVDPDLHLRKISPFLEYMIFTDK